MWTLDNWLFEVRCHLDQEEVYADVIELEELFDQGLSPSETLLYFTEYSLD